MEKLTSLTNEKTIGFSPYKPSDLMKLSFLRKHYWDVIKEKEKSYKAEGVVVLDNDTNSLEVMGTKAGRDQMIFFLKTQALKVTCKVCIFIFLLECLIHRIYLKVYRVIVLKRIFDERSLARKQSTLYYKSNSYTECITKRYPNLMLYNSDTTNFYCFILGSLFSLIFCLFNKEFISGK